MRARAHPLEATTPIIRLRPEEVRALTRAMLEGNEGGFRRFHDIYGWRLFRLAATLLGGDLESAEDIVQETMVRIVRHIKSFDCETAFWNWLAAIVRNLVLDQKRSRFRFQQFLQRRGFWLVSPPAQNPGAEDPKEVEIHLLEIALMQLDPPNALLLRRKYQEGLSLKDLAQIEGLTVEAIESRLARARAKLKNLMQASAVRHHE